MVAEAIGEINHIYLGTSVKLPSFVQIWSLSLDLTLLSTHHTGYITTGSFKGRRNQDMLVAQGPSLQIVRLW